MKGLLLLCACVIYQLSSISAYAVNKTTLGDVASPFVEPQEPRPGMKGDDESDDDSSLLAYQVAPKDAKSFLRVRRGWIKGITGEEEEEEEASQRERNREQNERNAEASALARICSTSCWGPFGAYGACTAPCGNNGVQTATRRVTPSAQCQSWVAANGCPGSATTTRACNRMCHNGGTPRPGSCACSAAFTGTCCETRITCGSPGSISNGAVSPSGSTHNYGTTVTFACNTGYRLVGGATRTCQANSQWSGTVPTCQMITCGDPGTPTNGGRTLTSAFNYGSSARFTCDTGYNLQGDAVRRCELSGDWSGTQPVCQQIVCPAPPALPNGSVQTPGGHIYDADAIYSCNAGFYLQGVATRTCQTNAQWGGDMPTCEAIICPNLPDPSHGIVAYSRQMSYGSVASYSCDTGYRLTGGNAARTCGGSGPTGTWSGAAPTCNIVSCPDPGTPNQGVKLGSTYTYGSAVSYQCLAGYTISGATRIECQANQQWTADIPTCSACPLNSYKPGSNVDECSSCPAHTHTDFTASVASTQCLCDEGYRGPNGGPCVLIVCPDIPLPAHAVQVSCNKHFRGQCRFDCVDGHVRTAGDDVRVCEYESVWSGDDIVCSACPRDTYKSLSGTCLGCPAYSHTVDTGNQIEGCVCDTGFERLGEPGTQCTDIDECADDNGGCDQTCENTLSSHTCLCTDPGFIKDEENPEKCIPKNNCPPLQAPDNGGFVCVGQPRTNTQRCQVKCNSGYEHVLEPTYYEECGPTSNWQWSHTLRDVPIMPCELQFFEGFQMEAEVFYFVSSCDSLTDAQITAAKQEFLSFLSSQNLCGTSGMIQCSISDVTLECGDVTFKRRKRSTNFRLKFKFTVAIPALPRSEVDCNDYCVRQSYCEERCADNYNAAAESELVTVSNVIPEIFDRSNTDLPTAPIPPDNELPTEEDTAVTFGGILLVPDAVEVQNVTAFCDEGFTSSNDKCVPCPAGSFFGDAECHPCPERTYQPETQALECRPCATAKEKGMDNCPPRRNPFDIIINAAIDVANEVEEAAEEES